MVAGAPVVVAAPVAAWSRRSVVGMRSAGAGAGVGGGKKVAGNWCGHRAGGHRPDDSLYELSTVPGNN